MITYKWKCAQAHTHTHTHTESLVMCNELHTVYHLQRSEAKEQSLPRENRPNSIILLLSTF